VEKGVRDGKSRSVPSQQRPDVRGAGSAIRST
jgi:hypothetical protein